MSRGRETWHALPKELVAALNQLGRKAVTEERKSRTDPNITHRLAHRARAQAFREAQRITRASYGVRLIRGGDQP